MGVVVSFEVGVVGGGNFRCSECTVVVKGVVVV